jgi:hypothetical protein
MQSDNTLYLHLYLKFNIYFVQAITGLVFWFSLCQKRKTILNYVAVNGMVKVNDASGRVWRETFAAYLTFFKIWPDF